MSSAEFWSWLRLIVLVLIVAGLIGGFSFNGQHYGLSCSRERGVEVTTP